MINEQNKILSNVSVQLASNMNAALGIAISMDDINTMLVWISRFNADETNLDIVKGELTTCYMSGKNKKCYLNPWTN